MNAISQIRVFAKQLGLSNLSVKSFEFLTEPVSNEDFLLSCLQDEVTYREEKAKQRRIKQACLPTYKGFETFDTEFQKGITLVQNIIGQHHGLQRNQNLKLILLHYLMYMMIIT